MALINDDAQWIILMGFVISVSIFFLAIVANESTLVGQTTSESVLEFSKSDIQDLRDEIARHEEINDPNDNYMNDIRNLSIQHKNTIVLIQPVAGSANILIHYNDGVTIYNENASFPRY
jgi:hypothetical protein